MTASCALCFSEYIPKKRKNHSPYCSKSCETLFRGGRTPGPKRISTKKFGLHPNEIRRQNRNKNLFKTCQSCGIEKDLNQYYNERKRYWSICKQCHLKMKEWSWLERINEETTFSRCYKLLQDFKSKRFSLDYIDLLRLIDIWDQIYPNDVPQKEPNFDWILNRVANWFEKEKERISKEEL
jgi:hypothetical protein